MTITTGSAHLPALGAHEREEMGHELQATLLELIDLWLSGKRVPLEYRRAAAPAPLHLYLDELIDSWRDLGDTVAERAVAVGFWPDGQADAVAAGSEITRVESGAVEIRHVLVSW